MKIEKYLNIKVRKSLVPLCLVLCLVLALLWAWRFWHAHEPSGKENDELLALAAKQLERHWKEGGDRIDLRCHPMAMEQYLAQNPVLKVSYQHRIEQVEVVKHDSKRYLKFFAKQDMQWVSSPQPAYRVLLRHNGSEASLFFKSDCRELYLPQRKYAYGEFNKQSQEWGNFNYHIFIDKFLVKQYDVMLWLESTKRYPELIKILASSSDLSMPIAVLKPQQMREYCSFMGKQLLTDLVLDAASFHPITIEDPLHAGRGTYVWTKNKSLSFLYQASNDPSVVFEKRFCDFLSTKECLSVLPKQSSHLGTPSWLGLFQVLGGYLEFVEAKVNPEKNLRASSFYFDFRSNWHEAGKRAFWDGQGWGPNNFNWFDEAPVNDDSNYKIGFRCMKYDYIF